MTAQEIRDAIDLGKKVFWGNPLYPVIKDSKGQYLITCTQSSYCIGLTHVDNVTLNGDPETFYVQNFSEKCKLSNKKIEELFTKKGLEITDVIDAVIRINGITGVGLITLGDQLQQYCYKWKDYSYKPKEENR